MHDLIELESNFVSFSMFLKGFINPFWGHCSTYMEAVNQFAVRIHFYPPPPTPSPQNQCWILDPQVFFFTSDNIDSGGRGIYGV